MEEYESIRGHYFFATVIAALCAVGNSPVAEAQMSVSVKTDRAFVAIDLNTAEVFVQPQWGTLENTTDGIVYVPNFPDGTDSFAFVADHAFLDVPVTFIGDVVDGVVHLAYQHAVLKEGDDTTNGTENSDETITIGDVTGTIIQGPGTTIDFPEGTVVIGTNESVPDDIAIIDSVEGSEIHTHDDISSLDELSEILDSYEDGSIPAIVFVGHGADGGVQLSGNGDDLDGDTLTDGDHQDLIDLINDKLEDDATIYIIGCTQFDQDDAEHLQDLADATGHPVVANEGDITIDMDEGWWWWEDDEYLFYGHENWVEVTPEDAEGDAVGSP